MTAPTDTQRTAAATFVGWAKPKGQRWRPVCRHADEAACWAALLDIPHAESKAVLRAGQTPWKRRWWLPADAREHRA
jgi:hypothetical protein